MLHIKNVQYKGIRIESSSLGLCTTSENAELVVDQTGYNKALQGPSGW